MFPNSICAEDQKPACLLIAGFCIFFITSCAGPRKLPDSPLGFQEAVRLLANNLMDQLRQEQSVLEKVGQTTRLSQATEVGRSTIAVIPFVDADSGEAVQVTKEIEQIILSVFKGNPGISIEMMAPANLAGADYVMAGILLFDTYSGGTEESGQGYYHIFTTIIDRRTRKIIASADIWIADTDLDYTPAAIYENSPMFPRDRRLDSLVVIAKSPVGTQADKEYYESLETNALLVEAESIYEVKDYEKSLNLFQQAAERNDGKVLKTYIGLYKNNIKLQDQSGAETAFSTLLSVGVENNNISTKFLFLVGSTNFINDESLQSQYSIWLRQIAKYFGNNSRCINIVGHCSNSGPEEYNESLSLSRAQKIQQLMSKYHASIPNTSRTFGKGFHENIVGSGTDDARDAVDRRVEFELVDCW